MHHDTFCNDPMLSIFASLGSCGLGLGPVLGPTLAFPGFTFPGSELFSCLSCLADPWKPVIEDVSPTPPPSAADIAEKYVATELARFHAVPAEEWSDPKHSSNVDPRMFDLEFAFKPNTVDKYAALDAEWKRRILVETTPSGLVYMYYWPQEQCFAYIASGQVPVSILNACAMKYVRLFRCRSLFNESKYLPAGVVGATHVFNLAVDEREQETAKSNKPSYLHPKIVVDPRYTVQYKQTSRALKKSVAMTSACSFNRFKQVETKLSYAPFLQRIPFVAPAKAMSYADYKAKLLAEHQVDIEDVTTKKSPGKYSSLFRHNLPLVRLGFGSATHYDRPDDIWHQPQYKHEGEDESGSGGEDESGSGGEDESGSGGEDESGSGSGEDESISSFHSGDPEKEETADPGRLSVLVPENCCGTPLSTVKQRQQPTPDYDYSSSVSSSPSSTDKNNVTQFIRHDGSVKYDIALARSPTQGGKPYVATPTPLILLSPGKRLLCPQNSVCTHKNDGQCSPL